MLEGAGAPLLAAHHVVTETEVRHVAKLARLALSDAEIDKWCPN